MPNLVIASELHGSGAGVGVGVAVGIAVGAGLIRLLSGAQATAMGQMRAKMNQNLGILMSNAVVSHVC